MSGYDENPGIIVAQQIKNEPDSAVSLALKSTLVSHGEWLGRNLRPSKSVFPVMATPPTIAALATVSGITSGIAWSPMTSGQLAPPAYTSEHWRYLGAQRPIIYGTVSPDYSYVKFQSFTLPSGNAVGAYGVEFYHYGTQIEFQFKGMVGNYQILVDDELVQTSAFAVSNTGSQYRQLITFASAAVRKIRFVGYNIPFGGVTTGPTDQIWVPEKRCPRVAILGDSYTGGTGSTAGTITSWCAHMCEALGWYDNYFMYAGGSGYLNPGQGSAFSSRVANDIIANAPDIVVVAGGHNDDNNYTTAAIGSAASSLFSTIQAGLPNAKLIVTSPFWGAGPSGWNASTIDTRDALSTAAAAAGAPFIDVMDMPLGRTAQTGAMAGALLVGATTVASPINVPVRSWLQIDQSTAYDRRMVAGESGSAAPFTLTVSALSRAHSAGATIREVGPPFITGTGKAGTPTGDGNADVFTYSDGTHWTDAGHAAIGRTMAELISRLVLAY